MAGEAGYERSAWEPRVQEQALSEEQTRWGPTEWSAEASLQDSEIRGLVGEWINTEPGTPGYERVFERLAVAARRGAFARGQRRRLEHQRRGETA